MCDVKSKIRLCQSLHIYLKNNASKFHSYLIWNDEALDFSWRGHSNKKNKKNSSNTKS